MVETLLDLFMWVQTGPAGLRFGKASWTPLPPHLPQLSILGEVYDVTKGKRIYGPKGLYHFFAGRDASRAYVTGCFSNHLTHDLRGLDQDELSVSLEICSLSLLPFIIDFSLILRFFFSEISLLLPFPISKSSPGANSLRITSTTNELDLSGYQKLMNPNLFLLNVKVCPRFQKLLLKIWDFSFIFNSRRPEDKESLYHYSEEK